MKFWIRILIAASSLSLMLLTVILFSGFPKLSAFVPMRGTLNLTNGESLFLSNCSGCHSVGSKPVNNAGPSLYQIGITASKRKLSMTAEEYIIESITEPAAFKTPGSSGVMPNAAVGLSTSDIRNLAAYLMSQGGVVDADEIKSVKFDEPSVTTSERPIDRELMASGEDIFRSKAQCTKCHRRNSLVAPSLNGIGVKGHDYILQSILYPHAVVPEKYRTSQIVMDDGKILSGRILRTSDTEIRLSTWTNTGDQQVQDLSVDDIAHDANGKLIIQSNSASSMPSNYKDVLSESELETLVYFLNRMPWSGY